MRPLLLVAAFLASACSLHKSELEGTLKWMDNTYNAHENVSGAYGHGRMAWYARAKGPNGERTEVMAFGNDGVVYIQGMRSVSKDGGRPGWE